MKNILKRCQIFTGILGTSRTHVWYKYYTNKTFEFFNNTRLQF